MYFKQKALLWCEIDVCFEPYQDALIEAGAGNGSGSVTSGYVRWVYGGFKTFLGAVPSNGAII
jgi:hypothetical protein